MPTITHDILLRGIDKDVAPNGLDYSGRRVLNPVRDVLNGRYFSSEDGEVYVCEAIKGTQKVGTPPAPPTLAGLASWIGAPWTVDGVQWNSVPQVVLTALGQQSRPLVGAITNGYANSLYTVAVNWTNTPVGSTASMTVRFFLFSAAGQELASASASVQGTGATRITSLQLHASGGTPAYVGVQFSRQAIPGSCTVRINSVAMQATSSSSSSLPSGTNEVIGVHENQERNMLIYFVWNSGGRHQIWTLDGNTNVKSVLIEDQPNSSSVDPARGVLNFERNRLITAVGMVGDLLFWSNYSTGVHVLNITRQYSIANGDYKLALHKLPPVSKPVILQPGSNASIPKTKMQRIPTTHLNRLATDSVQFAARYVYIDNMVSCLGPYSDLVPAETYATDKLFQPLRNRIIVSVPNETDKQAPLIKYVELLYRVGNSEQWFIFHRFEAPFSGATLQVEFYNDQAGELVPTEQTGKLFDLVPDRAGALTLFKNRLFLTVGEEGIDLEPASLTASLSSDINTIDVTTNGNGGFLKKNSQYQLGVVGHDHFGRTTGVYAKTSITTKQLEMAPAFDMFNSSPGLSDVLNRSGNRANLSVTGALPKQIARWSVVMTEQQIYETYFQSAARLDFYVKDLEPGEGLSGGNHTAINDRIYLAVVDLVNTKPWTYCHFFLPMELPFPVDNTFFVRIINSNKTQVTERVIDVIGGNILVTGKFSGINFTQNFKRWGGALGISDVPFLDELVATSPVAMGVAVFIEVFKLKEKPSLFFYEVAGPFNKSGQGISANLSNIEGDTYYRGGYTGGLNPEAGTQGSPADMASINADGNYRAYRFSAVGSKAGNTYYQAQARETTALIQQETPSPSYISGGGSLGEQGEQIFERGGVSSNLKKKGYTPDYSKAAWSRGRVFTEVRPRKVRRPCAIRFSDVYLEGTQINGLNSFPVGNEYDKIGEDRSPITRLQPVGNVILAIHERNITSLYVGEGVVRTGDTGFLSKTDDVVGDDRKLLGSYGTIHPESVQEHNGQVFGWDIHAGAVWRYTVEGIIPISDFGMKSFFKEVAQRYLPVRNDVRFVSAIDAHHKEYLLVLPTATVNGQLIQGETWAFNFEANRWVQRYSFVPEFMARLGKRLFGFKNGEPWEHNVSSYNLFYGSFYDRKIVAACNFQPDKVKTWSGIQITGDMKFDQQQPGDIIAEFSIDSQYTYTRVRDLEFKQGTWYGPILKDVNTSPALIPPGRIALRHGKDMRGPSIMVTLHDRSHQRARLQKITLAAEYSEFST